VPDSNGSGDAAAPGAPGADDDVQTTSASRMVVAAVSIGWRRCAERRPELVVLRPSCA
jgi:hypothetical protein